MTDDKMGNGNYFHFFGTLSGGPVKQVVPRHQIVIGGIKRPMLHERGAQRRERIGALGEKKVDLHFMVAKSS